MPAGCRCGDPGEVTAGTVPVRPGHDLGRDGSQLDRAGGDPSGLLERQKVALEPIVQAIKAERPGSHSFDATLLAWRRATTAATLSFLDELTRATAATGSR
jgi:hypothetical protein